ncbi:hypothetical protein C8J32_11057 [Rhizobium sp. PP-CC-3A-592]|nr:hypothetical protein C8J32_11057 [Rhizobium sp. PP-CC-3A-592]
MLSLRTEIFAQRLFDHCFHGIGNRLCFGRMAEESEGLPQQPLLQQKDWPKDLDTVSNANFFKMLWRLNNLTLPLKRFAHIVLQAKKRAFFVDDKR